MKLFARKYNNPKVTTVQGFIAKVISAERKVGSEVFIEVIQIKVNTNWNNPYLEKMMKGIFYTLKVNISYIEN